MRISVVVPSYRRPDDLRRCLAALTDQERPPDEIIVVYRAGDERTKSIAQAPSAQPVQGVAVDRPGVLAAMDAGVSASSGDVIAFTDDDAAPRSDWLGRIQAGLEDDPKIAAVGGRDWCWYGSRLVVDGHHPRVGRVQWFGRLTSGHHAGVGPPQNVQVLKGCNMAFRREVLLDIGFDRRLRGHGAQTHFELSLCLQALRRGWTLRYDPSIAVDHYPAPRHDLDQRERPAYEAVEDSAHNETLALLEHLGGARRVAFAVWSVAVGTRPSPGILQAIRRRATGDTAAFALFRAVVRGRRAGVRTFVGRPAARRPARSLAVVAHSLSGIDRATQLFGDAGARIVTGGRSAAGLRRALGVVFHPDTRAVYLVDVGFSTAIAAVAARALGRRLVVDTGDISYELARSVGRRGRLAIALIWLGERTTLALAQHVVVRGTAHVAHLPGRATTVIRDLPPLAARPVDGSEIRRDLGWEDRFVVGLVGSLNYAPRLGIGYGWDLVEALALCDKSVVGLIVGDGPGRPVLEQRAQELGLTDRLHFAGTMEVTRAVAAIAAMDVAISTQTNDAVGAVRTTGKLPLYLACGCPVLASHVGEAAVLIGPLGWTLAYDGTIDESYPLRLADGIARWSQDSEGQPARRRAALDLATHAFRVVDARRHAFAALDIAPPGIDGAD